MTKPSVGLSTNGCNVSRHARGRAPDSGMVAVPRELLGEIIEFYDGIVDVRTTAPGLPNGSIVPTILLVHALGHRIDKLRALLAASKQGE